LPDPFPVAPWQAAQWPERTRHEIDASTSLARCLGDLAMSESLRRFRGCSLWWSLRPGEAASSLSVAVGWPTRESFVHMLEGVW
jgi:hypothetical protein